MTSVSYKDMLAFLEHHLGGLYVAFTTGVSNAHTVAEWIQGTEEPSAEQIEKISVAYEVFERAWRARGTTATSWFLGSHLNVPAPWLSISKGRYGEARASAERFLGAVSPA